LRFRANQVKKKEACLKLSLPTIDEFGAAEKSKLQLNRVLRQSLRDSAESKTGKTFRQINLERLWKKTRI